MNIDWTVKEYASNFSHVPNYEIEVMKLITAPVGSRVLDWGCGNGTLTRKPADFGFDVS